MNWEPVLPSCATAGTVSVSVLQNLTWKRDTDVTHVEALSLHNLRKKTAETQRDSDRYQATQTDRSTDRHRWTDRQPEKWQGIQTDGGVRASLVRCLAFSTSHANTVSCLCISKHSPSSLLWALEASIYSRTLSLSPAPPHPAPS